MIHKTIEGHGNLTASGLGKFIPNHTCTYGGGNFSGPDKHYLRERFRELSTISEKVFRAFLKKNNFQNFWNFPDMVAESSKNAIKIFGPPKLTKFFSKFFGKSQKKHFFHPKIWPPGLIL